LHPVGFVNSVAADLQGNRAGAREAFRADWVAAVRPGDGRFILFDRFEADEIGERLRP